MSDDRGGICPFIYRSVTTGGFVWGPTTPPKRKINLNFQKLQTCREGVVNPGPHESGRDGLTTELHRVHGHPLSYPRNFLREFCT